MSCEDKSFEAKYIDKSTNEEVTLSCALTKNPNTSDTILLCHGMFGDKDSEINLPLLEGLKQHWSVLRFDFEGNGHSSGEWSYANYPREVRNIGDLVDYVETNCNLKIVGIIGHSKAGADVMIAASQPDLIKNKDCCFVSLGGRLTFGKPEKRFTQEELEKAKTEGSFLWERFGKQWKITQEAIDERRTMNPKIGVKNIDDHRAHRILHVHGTIDTSTPTEEASVIEKEIPGAEIKWIEGANHFFTGKEKEMVDTVVSWLLQKLK
jgi:pimeloyl-ACP methyl ester carboxylesterase